MRSGRRIGEIVDDILAPQGCRTGGGHLGLVGGLADHIGGFIGGVAVEAQFLPQHLERCEQERLAGVILLMRGAERREPRPLVRSQIFAGHGLVGQLGELRPAENQPQHIARRHLGLRAEDHTVGLLGGLLQPRRLPRRGLGDRPNLADEDDGAGGRINGPHRRAGALRGDDDGVF